MADIIDGRTFLALGPDLIGFNSNFTRGVGAQGPPFALVCSGLAQSTARGESAARRDTLLLVRPQLAWPRTPSDERNATSRIQGREAGKISYTAASLTRGSKVDARYF
jgi:hypothetical protein